MNKNSAIAVLLIGCIGLAVAVVALKTTVDNQHKRDAAAMMDFSNELGEANIRLNGLRQVNITLSDDLVTNRELLADVSNRLDQSAAQLADTSASLDSARQQMTNLDLKISDLTAENEALDATAASLSNHIATLNGEIAMTRATLANSETNNIFLENELKRQVTEKTVLEGKFNSLAAIRQQIRRLKMDLLMARRLKWMREGTDPSREQVKGGELLMRHGPSPAVAAAAAPRPNSSLNVEVESSGAVRVLPPGTNGMSP
ncbi:MAG: hypothetical protein KGJ88_09270 [Verrucomicrobiota bacterium]|nr:hypothetical protein [Verrucomicrobiota bacterium]